MDVIYQVFEPSEEPGEVILVAACETFAEASAVASTGEGRTIEIRSGLTARVVAGPQPGDITP